jgi:hypothetical protein
MSQINEALKRAKKSQKSQPPNLPPGLPSLSPVEPESRGTAGWILLVVALVVIGCFLIVLALAPHKPLPQTDPAPPARVAIPAPLKPVPVQTNIAIIAPPKPAPPALRLQGILMGSGQPQAVVNGQTVFVGDIVNGFRVQLISQYNVSFIAPDGTEKTLALAK